MKTAVCKTCNATLLISAERLPICGRCGGQVEEAKSEIRKVYAGRRRRIVKWIIACISLTVAGVALIELRGAVSANMISALELVRSKSAAIADKSVLALIAVVVVASLSFWIVHRRRARQVDAQPFEPLAGNLKEKVERLAAQAWGGREDIISNQLILRPESLSKLMSPADFVAALLKHVSRVAPNLSVPIMTPRIVHERLCDAAGQFVEQNGWVKISVDANFFDNQAAAHAILCHELCHYVLGANGIREKPTLENERLTDVAMFVFGLGDIFLAGYARKAGGSYRTGHRLGYLTDDEYTFVKRHVIWLRGAEVFLRRARGRKDDWNWDRSLR